MSDPKLSGLSSFFLQLFRWYCDPYLVEDIEGDLLERFELRAGRKGIRKANWLFIKDVILLFRPGIIRHLEGFQRLNSYDMFKNYLKTARRNLLKQKMYSSIKIGGFALGIAACLLIGLFIRDELSYDKHYENQDELYRVVVNITYDRTVDMVWMPAPFARTLMQDYPEIELTGRINPGGTFGGGDNQIRPVDQVQNSKEEGFAFADPSILEIFEVPMLYGDRNTALADANSMVISKAKAEKLFPGINPVGQMVIINENTANPIKIGGVMDEPEGKSHFEFDFLLSLVGREFWPGEQNYWSANNYNTYVRVKPGANIELLQDKMDEVAMKYVLPSEEAEGNVNAQTFAEGIDYSLQPLDEIHLYSDGIEDPFVHGDIEVVILFATIAALVLVIAIINFVNLATAKSANRAMEVGLRKAIGSQRGHLIWQFLVESTLLSFCSFILGLAIASLLLPYFNEMAMKTLSIPFTAWWFVPSLVLATLLVGVLAGIYPAFYLSGFRPSQVLKGSLSLGAKKSGLRSVLVVFQFATSIALIIATMVVGKQMNYILNKDLGFSKEQVVMLEGTNILGENTQSFKNSLLNLPTVASATYSNFLPVSGTFRNDNIFVEMGKTETAGANGQFWLGDHDYIKTMGIEVIEGRDFSRDMATDSSAVIINRELADRFGFDNPIGKKITNGNPDGFTIIGVIENFHFESFKGEIGGLCLKLGPSTSTLSVKLATDNMAQALDQITEVWDQNAPGQIINYSFLDDRFERMYADVKRTGSIFTSFASFAIIVACLGLFGLSVFMLEQRNKEISIRLVLGAPVANILKILGLGFLKPVFIAMIIAGPLAWYFMSDWLSDYEYGIPLSWDIFALAGIVSIGIAMTTVSYQSLKAARLKPVDGLRHE